MFAKYLIKGFLPMFLLMFLTSNFNALNFSDGTFNNLDWRCIVQQLGNGGTVETGQQTEGGNYFRQIKNTINKHPAGLAGHHFFEASLYNPAKQGEITSFDFSIDHKMFIGFGEGQSIGAAIYQDGNLFMGGVEGQCR